MHLRNKFPLQVPRPRDRSAFRPMATATEKPDILDGQLRALSHASRSRPAVDLALRYRVEEPFTGIRTRDSIRGPVCLI
jgi:hypothetical protein